MKKFSNIYILLYSGALLAAAAIVLSVANMLLAPRQQHNEQLEQKMLILKASGIEATARNADRLFSDSISTVNLGSDEEPLPAYRCGDRHIIELHGNGLWGPIWGYLCFDAQWTVCGAVFDHKGETPGLGGNISTEEFARRFVGKSCLDATAQFIPIILKKNANNNSKHEVDAISGGTMTSNGVTNMLHDCLAPYSTCMQQTVRAQVTSDEQ
ncbi:MAG: FMN-binding protein [Bacteroidales bacterium]|nr:FMN-binding protein [Bacteroidales bacterium]